MKIGEILKHPAVSNLIVTFLASLLAYGAIKFWESRNTTSTDTTKPKEKEKLPAPATATTVATENAQEVTQTVQ
ncbi:DUF2681 domain-containing protein [Parvicella tangerina]|uniref:Uncharacterized protein n=1 Tax=Parvicella tangerina TaxID=2829795 RepID=A0A916JMR8_9FLAO|nr:DUF2681 domain-containing protein [Parvicella tangerina]CAG5082290.1 hypothetical protein CRYO30217_01867 [Parvicella tangerina]